LELDSNPWSSYAANVSVCTDRLLTPHPCFRALGTTASQRAERYRGLFGETLDPQEIAEFRAMSRKELAFGSDRFKDDVEVAAERRTRAVKRWTSRSKSGAGVS
jgi:putative transposase